MQIVRFRPRLFEHGFGLRMNRMRSSAVRGIRPLPASVFVAERTLRWLWEEKHEMTRELITQDGSAYRLRRDSFGVEPVVDDGDDVSLSTATGLW